jgi:GT2 family glycosyltransferase/predicted Zn-dependent protease
VSSTQALRLRVWQALAAISPALASLPEELRVATAQHSETAWHWHALGVVTSTLAPENAAVAAVPHLRQAIALAREHPLVRLSYAQNLLLAGQPQAAAQEARQLLTHLHQYPPDLAMLQEWHSPATFDEFRVAWERAGWEGAGQPAIERRTKRQLLLWRVQALLAQATGHLAHFYEAVLAHPTAVSARAALGAALGRQEQFALAVPHLQQAQQNCPFDPAISRLLGEALARSQQAAAQQQLVQELRRRARCVPSLPRESWFADTARPATELTSILILCCNEVAYTQQCLESLLQTTVPPYELILVNNGSTDGTAAYLDNVKNRSGPARVVVLHNPTNVGFAAGCNQALAQAQGTYLVLLNNDTILTPGWLEGLLAWTRQEGPPVGLVGPVSNYVPPPQHVTPDYTDPAGLAAFAQGRRRLFAGHAVATERLSGFCLLVRQEVFDRIGTLDEQFALGFFEDDDLCVRAREAGFRLLIALDVYIHHYGSRTFSGLGLNSQERLHENFAKFQAKWGSARTAGYRWPEPSKTVATALVTEEPSPVIVPIASLPAEAITLPGVSLTMIVKNEEANLGACLTSAADLVQEVVIVDTGSTDRTKEIAQQFGARVIDFPWIDHFAAARNESLRHARGQWCFWLDADDRLDETNRQRLRHLFATLPAENIGFVMKCLCLPDPQTQATTMVHHVRLFPNRPDVRWQYRVHEQILPALRRANGMVRWSDVVIQHVGYQDPALRRRKLDRDLRLLRLEEREQPDEPFVLFNLGSVCLELGQTADALSYLRRSLTKSAPEDSIVRKLYALLIKAHRQEQQLPRALQVCAEGQYHYPDDPELRFQEAQLRRDLGDFAGAEKCFRQVLATPEGDYFASVDIGLRTYLARHNLGVVLRDQGRGEEAAEHWRQVVAEQPGYGPSLLALAEHYLEQNENGKFAILMDQLAVLPNLAHETELLHNRALLAQGCFRAAQDGFRRLIVQNPHWLPPRLFLSHALLQEGRDWRAAEQALLDILVLAPSHSDARKNLEVLRHLYLSRE